MQNEFTDSPLDVPEDGLPLNGFAVPMSSIGNTWHSVNAVLQVCPHWQDEQVPGEPTQLGGLQSATVLQPRNVSTLHVEMVGPSGPQ